MAAGPHEHLRVSVVIPARRRPRELAIVLDKLAQLPVHEVLLVENGPTGIARLVDADARGVRVLETPENVGVAARNLAGEHATGELLLMLDDDSYPLPGAIERLTAAFAADPRLAVAGGLVRDVDLEGTLLRVHEPGTFDWFLRAEHRGGVPADGIPTFFFPACAALVRRSAFLEVGGFLAEFFHASLEVELSTRLLARGWDVRYFPTAEFEHLKSPDDRTSTASLLYHRIRNHVWYVWLHFPAPLAARRIPAYLAFDLVEALYRRQGGAWVRGVRDAWRLRGTVSGRRRPLPRPVVRRAELNRGRLHVRLLAEQARRRLPR